MATEKEEYFATLSVPNVQDLSSNVANEIPDRYIRPEFQSEFVCDDNSFEIPVIDFSRILDEKFGHDEMAKLHMACEEWGFFQLINHGAEEAIEKIKNHVEEFFKQPLDAKKAYAQEPNSMEGYGQAFVQSDDQKLDWGDMYLLRALPARTRNMKFWPNYPLTFREILERYSSEVQKLAIRLLGLMAENLGLEEKKLTDMFGDMLQALRMNYYPPCQQADKENGIWVPVHAIPGAFIINIGDMLEIWSNGKYKSIEHRVVVNPRRERLSVAAFHAPNEDSVIGPLSDLVKKEGAKYKSIDLNSYYKLNNTLQGKKHANEMKLVNTTN
ncbi:hypothetical protein Sjap_004333 [Stephania japonica]|uniref:Fe2OG dioxygenase domain-containing protein n=1 Tax=Stephania japonica TaxID=461633 RepID=A0AAP0PK68_9MAGN